MESIASTENLTILLFRIKVEPSTLPICPEGGPRVSKGLIFHVLQNQGPAFRQELRSIAGKPDISVEAVPPMSAVSHARIVLAILSLSCFFWLGEFQAAQATDLTGCWKGCWQDCRHSGPLRASFCKCDDTHYRVTFTGTFFKVLPFRYTVTLNVTKQEGNKVYLAGESYLGRLFGTFTYDGWATDCELEVSYSSCRYQGQFILRRCP